MPVNRNLAEISRNGAGVNVKGEILARMLFHLMVSIFITHAVPHLQTTFYHIFDSIVLYHHIIMQDFLFACHYNTDKRTIMPLSAHLTEECKS